MNWKLVYLVTGRGLKLIVRLKLVVLVDGFTLIILRLLVSSCCNVETFRCEYDRRDLDEEDDVRSETKSISNRSVMVVLKFVEWNLLIYSCSSSQMKEKYVNRDGYASLNWMISSRKSYKTNVRCRYGSISTPILLKIIRKS